MQKQSWTKLFGGIPPPTATHLVDLDAAMLAGLFGFLAGCTLVCLLDRLLWSLAGFGFLPDLPVIEHGQFWIQGVFGGEDWTRYLTWLNALERDGRLAVFLARLAGCLCIPALLSLLLARYAGRERELLVHRQGRRLFEGSEALKRLTQKSRAECRSGGAGLPLHPRIRLSLRRECGHLLFIGTSGGGKTVAMKPLIYEALRRGDKTIIYDNKGEMTEEIRDRYDQKGKLISGNHGVPRFMLIAPWDVRSSAWDIAADCCNSQDAAELATRFIPDSKDPMWSAAAQQVFRAMLIELMKTQGSTWGWSELATLVVSEATTLRDIVGRNVPEALSAVADAESKTTQSIAITMRSFLSPVMMLAEAWKDVPGKPPRPRISFRRFVADANYRHRTIVLQGNGRYANMVRSLIGGILQTVSATMNSGACPDSESRRIWLFLDEFPQLGKVPNFAPFLEVGRSKGLRVCIGAQDHSQIRQHYSEEEANTFLSQIKTWVVVKFPPGPTAEWISRTVGNRRVQVQQQSHGPADKGRGGSVSVSHADVDLPVIHPAEIESKLGASERWNGIRALVLGYEDAYLVNFPFRHYVKTQPALVEARWTRIRKTKSAKPVDEEVSPAIVPESSDNTKQDEQAEQAMATTVANIASEPDDFMKDIFGAELAEDVLGKVPFAGFDLPVAKESDDDDHRTAG
ncbi:MAG: type IV secretion system DNA-binding domain-containing protein [Verrucomicrobiota bacterium]